MSTTSIELNPTSTQNMDSIFKGSAAIKKKTRAIYICWLLTLFGCVIVVILKHHHNLNKHQFAQTTASKPASIQAEQNASLNLIHLCNKTQSNRSFSLDNKSRVDLAAKFVYPSSEGESNMIDIKLDDRFKLNHDLSSSGQKISVYLWDTTNDVEIDLFFVDVKQRLVIDRANIATKNRKFQIEFRGHKFASTIGKHYGCIDRCLKYTFDGYPSDSTYFMVQSFEYQLYSETSLQDGFSNERDDLSCIPSNGTALSDDDGTKFILLNGSLSFLEGNDLRLEFQIDRRLNIVRWAQDVANQIIHVNIFDSKNEIDFNFKFSRIALFRFSYPRSEMKYVYRCIDAYVFVKSRTHLPLYQIGIGSTLASLEAKPYICNRPMSFVLYNFERNNLAGYLSLGHLEFNFEASRNSDNHDNATTTNYLCGHNLDYAWNSSLTDPDWNMKHYSPGSSWIIM